MSDPYAQHPHYAPPGPGPEANFYAPADSVYQNPPYDYEPQNLYTQQSPPNQNYQYGSQYDLAQTPRSYPPQMSGPQQDYLNPASAGGFEQENNHRGSNADYYNAPTDEQDRHHPPDSRPQEADNTSDNEGTERNLAGALAGGAGGYVLGRQSNHGLLGAVGGAILGNFVGDKMEDKPDDEEDGHHHRHHHHGHHHHRHKHRHGHRHHSHHSHHRSHSRHSSHSGSY
ncbi:conserved histidine-rich protein [Aspergillus flavus AF70]|nr:conserved histidine-rich protein [Aspergillus flavus AF70]